MTPRPGRSEPPRDQPDKPAPAQSAEDDEDDGDIATPKRDRDDEAEAFDRR